MKRFLFVSSFLFVLLSGYAFSGLLFKPLTANVFEPRIGSFYQFDDSKLRLDIGASVDLAEFELTNIGKLSIGTDFFTYTRLRSSGNFKFPVETSDYFFGINSSFRAYIGSLDFAARLRIAHISSHMVDGMAEGKIFTKEPFTYSREFVDFVALLHYSSYRIYAGANFVFSTQPENVNKIIPQIGADFNGEVTDFMDFIAGYDFKMNGYDDIYTPVHTMQIGILFKTNEDIGILLSYYKYYGKSIHGMFFTENDTYNGLGFQVYFY